MEHYYNACKEQLHYLKYTPAKAPADCAEASFNKELLRDVSKYLLPYQERAVITEDMIDNDANDSQTQIIILRVLMYGVMEENMLKVLPNINNIGANYLNDYGCMCGGNGISDCAAPWSSSRPPMLAEEASGHAGYQAYLLRITPPAVVSRK